MLTENHYFTDHLGKQHLFIDYSLSLSPWITIEDLYKTLPGVVSYSWLSESIKIPEYHELTKYIPDNDEIQKFTGSREIVELIIIYMDKHESRDRLFEITEYAKKFDTLAIKMLNGLINFATLYNIDPLFDYIRQLLTISTNFKLYKPTLESLFAKLKPDEIKTIIEEIMDKKIDVNSVYNDLFVGKRSISYYYIFTKALNFLKTDYSRKAISKVCARMLKNIILPFREPINDIYTIIGLTDKSISLTSKFLHYFLKYPNSCHFDLRNQKTLPCDFDELRSAKTKKEISDLISLNLLVLSMNSYGRTPILHYFKQPDEINEI